MAVIHLLEQSTIDKIAAGEVVERPRSIVKELTENSIDAGASAITVEIRDGGISMIRVTDNGEGIEPDQIRTAFLRHATSKIEKVDDLISIRSFGFRGEALSSIAAVSHVELITKTRQSLMGIRYRMDGGIESGYEEVGAPDGSTFVVRDLFYNTPARRKFLKTAQTEAGYIAEFCSRLALSHPEISLKFMVNGSVRLSTSGNGKQKDVVYQVFGKEITKNLIELNVRQKMPEGGAPDRGEASSGSGSDFSVREIVSGDYAGMKLTGYLGKPLISRSNRGYEIFYVNGRLVSSPILSKAVEEGYETFLMQHKFPFVILSLDMDGKNVDVNVHPAKAQVRFSDGPGVYRFVKDAVKDTLTHRDLIIESAPDKPEKGLTPSEKRAQEALRRETAPEPFERRRREGLGMTAGPEKPGPGNFRTKEPDPGDLKPKAAGPGDFRTKEPGPGETASEDAGSRSPSLDQVRSHVEDSRRDLKQLFAALRNEEPAKADSPYERKYPKAGRQRQEAEARLGQQASLLAEGSLPDLLRDRLPIKQTDRLAETGSALEVPALASAASQMELSDLAAWSGPEKSPAPDGEEDSSGANDQFLSPDHVKEHRLIGQVFETYWIIEFHDSLYIVDQHAAHEKVMFERIMRRYREKRTSSQMLCPPMIVSLSMAEEDQLNANMDLFRSIGFEIDPFGDRDYAISAVPQDLFGLTEKEYFLQMLDSLSSETGKRSVETITASIATMACKAAVKGNTRLSRQEADALIGELLECDNPYNCPHGRPTIISMTRKELEKKFRRIV